MVYLERNGNMQPELRLWPWWDVSYEFLVIVVVVVKNWEEVISYSIIPLQQSGEAASVYCEFIELNLL